MNTFAVANWALSEFSRKIHGQSEQSAGGRRVLRDASMPPVTAMTPSVKLDELDTRIIALLNADARKSYRDIAKEVGASISTVSNRVRKLESEGVITGYAPLIDESKIGFDVLAIVGVKIHKGKLLEVQRRIAKDDRVTHVYDVTGEWDSIVAVRLRSTRELDGFIKRLGSMEYVENTYTQVVLNVVKEERRVLL